MKILGAHCIDSKGRMRQVFKEIGDCKEILGHGLETDPRQKGEIGWIVRLLLRIVGGTIPLKPIGPPPLPIPVTIVSMASTFLSMTELSS